MQLFHALDGYKSYLTGSSLIGISLLKIMGGLSPEMQALLDQLVIALFGAAVIALKSAIEKKSPALEQKLEPWIDELSAAQLKKLLDKIHAKLNEPSDPPSV